jgi:hypothetical protein
VILGFYAGKSHSFSGLGIFHGDLDFFDLHEKSLELSNYEIFPHKILKSRIFKKSSILIVKKFVNLTFYHSSLDPCTGNWQLCTYVKDYLLLSQNLITKVSRDPEVRRAHSDGGPSLLHQR